MTDKTYEQVAAANWPKERLPVDDGTRCPPFRATLFRLAEAISGDAPLTPELQELKDHLGECGACHSTVSSVVSLLTAKSKETTTEVLDHVAWEGTPLRRLRDCTKKLRLGPRQTVREVFATLCQCARLTEAEAFEAVGWLDDGTDELDGDAGVWLLRDLGIGEDLVQLLTVPFETLDTTEARRQPTTIAARPVGPPPEPE